jgi:PAS domain S-box-containing protein
MEASTAGLSLLWDLSSYTFSLYSVPTSLAGAAVLVLGFVALVRERGAPVSIAFFLLNVLAAEWLSSYSLVYSSTTEAVALWWVKAAHLGVIFIPAAVYHFTVTALRIHLEHKVAIWATWMTSALFFTAMATGDAFIGQVRRYWWGFYPDYGWLSVPFLLFFFSVMVASLRHYWIEQHKAPPGTHKLRTRSLLVAFAVAYIGSLDYVAAFRVALYPFGYLPVLAFIVLTARAMYRYRLVDITPAFAAREILDAMADAVLVLDRDGIVRVVNPAACQLLRSTERRLLGQSIEALTPTISTTAGLGPMIRSGSIRGHEISIATAEQVTILSVSSLLMRDARDQPVAVVVIARNITGHRKAEEEVRRHGEWQAALYELNGAITSTLDLTFVLNLLVEKIRDLLSDSPVVRVQLFNAETGALVTAASLDRDEHEWGGDRWASGRELPRLVFESKAPLVIADVQNNPGIENQEFYRRHGLICYLGVPLIAKDEVLGVLSIYTTDRHRFTSAEVEFLTALVGQAAIAIHNSRLREQIERQSAEPRDAGQGTHEKDNVVTLTPHTRRTGSPDRTDASGWRHGSDVIETRQAPEP